jgi:hypothetical protein
VASLDHVSWRLLRDAAAGGRWELQLKAKREVGEGEEVFLSYGKRSNDDFVLQYGFLPLGNPGRVHTTASRPSFQSNSRIVFLYRIYSLLESAASYLISLH